MNKGVGIGGAAGGRGPTAAVAAQKQKALLQRVDADVEHLVDNFEYLVNVARVNDAPFQNSQESFMMEMRAARIVQAADSLLKLVSELKQTAIFSGLASLNATMWTRELMSSINLQKIQMGCWLELEKRQQLVSRSLNPNIIPRP